MMVNVDRFMDGLLTKRPELRNDDAAIAAIFEALDENQPPPAPVPQTVFVQRVDEYVSSGVYKTSYEVVDRRLKRGDRVVRASLKTEAEARAIAAVRAPIGGAAYVLEAVDSDEYFHDTDYEILGNHHLYGVIGGCATTADAANMTVDLAVGAILHNGTYVAVAAAANAYTIVSDGSNERWAALTVSSAGSAVLVSGDAAANASTEPTKPEIGDRVLVTMMKIQAAQTIAANVEYDLDKRILTGPVEQINRSTSNFTSNADTTLNDATGLAFFVGASEVWAFEVHCQADIKAASDIKVAFTVPSGATITGNSTIVTDTGATQGLRASDFTAAQALATATTAGGLILTGIVVNSTTAGTVQLQAAQNASVAEDTTIYAQSFIKATRIA